jgi:hypothetical protein
VGSQLSFYFFAPHPDGLFGFTIFETGYLEKGALRVRGDLETRRTRKFFWVIFIFKQAV